MAWDDAYTGVPGTVVRDGLMSERDKKDTYYRAYIGNTWVSAAVDVIAKRFTSGGWEIEEIEQGKGNPANRDRLKALLLFVNEDEDFLQFLRAIATDLLIYGEAFCEIVSQNGQPVQLHKIDAVTMTTRLDKHGMVIEYTQTLERSSETIDFAPEDIIRWWLPDPRASKKALSPIERIKDAVYLYESMTTWAEKFFKQGARPAYSIELGEDSSIDDANRFIKFFKENYTGIQNAHVPPVNYGGSKLIESSKGSVEMDFLKGRAECRDEILSGYNVPLSMVGVQESAHLGSGTGDSANKALVYNTVRPLEQLILEKLNYRVVQKGMGITDYVITVRHADYRSDDIISKIQDTHIRNGSMTVNEARQENGRMPIEGGDTAVIVASRDIVPVERLSQIAQEQQAQAELSIQGAQHALQAPAAPSSEQSTAGAPEGTTNPATPTDEEPEEQPSAPPGRRSKKQQQQERYRALFDQHAQEGVYGTSYGSSHAARETFTTSSRATSAPPVPSSRGAPPPDIAPSAGSASRDASAAHWYAAPAPEPARALIESLIPFSLSLDPNRTDDGPFFENAARPGGHHLTNSRLESGS